MNKTASVFSLFSLFKSKKIYSLFAIIFIITASCKERKQNPDGENSTGDVSLKNISELTYPEIFFLLHEEEEYGFDFHGDLFGQNAMSQISLSSAQSTACGDAISLTSSNAEIPIKAVVKTSFSFPGNPTHEIFRIYHINPKSSIPVGRNKLCYGGSEYIIDREIVSAGFEEETN